MQTWHQISARAFIFYASVSEKKRPISLAPTVNLFGMSEAIRRAGERRQPRGGGRQKVAMKLRTGMGENRFGRW